MKRNPILSLAMATVITLCARMTTAEEHFAETRGLPPLSTIKWVWEGKTEDTVRFFLDGTDCGTGRTGFTNLLQQFRVGSNSVLMLYGIPRNLPVEDDALKERFRASTQGVPILQLDEEIFRYNELAVVSWITPFDNPVNEENADYSLNGNECGKGTNGFDTLLGKLSKAQSIKAVVLLGAPYSKKRSWPHQPAPFHGKKARLYDLLREKGIQVLGYIDRGL